MLVLITERAWPRMDGHFAGPVRLCEGWWAGREGVRKECWLEHRGSLHHRSTRSLSRLGRWLVSRSSCLNTTVPRYPRPYVQGQMQHMQVLGEGRRLSLE